MRNCTALLDLLESGDIDYTFEYESVASRRGLGFVALPEEIDLSSEDFFDRYGQVNVKMDFRRFTSISPEFVGEPILYGITIPANAPPRTGDRIRGFPAGYRWAEGTL